MNYILVLVVIGAFWLGVGVLDKFFNLSRLNIESMGIGIMWRTQKLNDFIDSISKKARAFWNVYAWAGVVLSTIGVLYIGFMLAFNTIIIITSPESSTAGASLAIPGVTIPFWYSILGLVVLIFAHELSHGIVTRVERLSIKSTGLGLFLVLPLAFVEPDEEELKKAPRTSRLKLFAAGSFANYLVYLLVSLLLVASVGQVMKDGQEEISPFDMASGVVLDKIKYSVRGLAEDGVLITKVMQGTPAEKALTKGTVIHGINSSPVKTVKQFQTTMAGFKPHDAIVLNTDRGDFELTLTANPQNPQRGYIGITIDWNYVERGSGGGPLSVVFLSLWWIAFLNLGIGLMNLLPVTYLLDGGKMVKEYLEMVLPVRAAGVITATVGVLSILLLVVNLLPGIFR